MLWVFVILGLATFTSVACRLAVELPLLARIGRGRAKAADVAAYLGLDSMDALDRFRAEHAGVLVVVPGLAGPYEGVEFTFSVRRLKAHRPASPLRSFPASVVIVLCVITAYAASHTSLLGWIALLVAVGAELLGWATGRRATGETAAAQPALEQPATGNEPPRRTQGATEVSAMREEVDAGKPTVPDDPQAQAVTPQPAAAANESPAPAAQTYTTCVLMRSNWRPVPEVFLASLRRCGQRDARLLAADADGTVHAQAGGIALTIRPLAAPMDAAIVAESSWHSESEREVAQTDHAAHVLVTTHAPFNAPPADVVRLHLRAHAAVAEFGPAEAACWPESRRLVAVQSLRRLAEQSSDALPIDVCAGFRQASLAPEESRTVLDTLGLHALGLPDLEIIIEGPPDDVAPRLLGELAAQFLASGPGVDEFLAARDLEQAWQAELGESSLAPSRRVIRLLAVGSKARAARRS